MKVIFGSDTKDFEKGAKEVKQGLRDLDKVGNDALSSLAGAFGINTGKISQMTSAITGLGQKLSQTGNAGVKAFGDILKSVGPVGGAIAGISFGAAIAGFKALKAEADNFKSTIDGMNLSMATQTYISTYQQAMHDAMVGTGKTVAETMSEFEKGMARLKSNAGAFLADIAGGKGGKWYDAILPTGIIRSYRNVSAAAKEANDLAEKGAVLGSQMAELKKRELTLNTEIAEKDAQIAEYRRIAKDTSKDAATRAEAEAAARTLVAEKYRDQITLARDMATVQQAIDDLAANDFEATKNTEEAKQRVLALEQQEQQELMGLDRLDNSIAKSTASQAVAWQKVREEQEKIAAVRLKWSGLGTVSTDGLSSVSGTVTTPSLTIVPQRQDVEYFAKTFQAYLGDFQLSIGFKADTEKIKDITNEVTSLVSSAVTTSAELIGNLFGTLAGGGDAWGDFKNAALSAFGDMAIAVGKIAISTGLAVSGIQAAINSGNWYIAVAAGVALVALGSAVKSSLSAVASGDYSAAGGGYSPSGYSSSGSGNWESREVNVNVTGSLEANGDKLIAVINNTNKKNYYTQ